MIGTSTKTTKISFIFSSFNRFPSSIKECIIFAIRFLKTSL
nr:MAG TPA: hypothetical protein [Siphoviridae sp. ct7JV2]